MQQNLPWVSLWTSSYCTSLFFSLSCPSRALPHSLHPPLPPHHILMLADPLPPDPPKTALSKIQQKLNISQPSVSAYFKRPLPIPMSTTIPLPSPSHPLPATVTCSTKFHHNDAKKRDSKTDGIASYLALSGHKEGEQSSAAL